MRLLDWTDAHGIEVGLVRAPRSPWKASLRSAVFKVDTAQARGEIPAATGPTPAEALVALARLIRGRVVQYYAGGEATAPARFDDEVAR